MKRTIHIIILFLCLGSLGGYGQNPLKELLDRMPASDREEYFRKAEQHIKVYYDFLRTAFPDVNLYASFAREVMAAPESLMAEDGVRCKPEILPRTDGSGYLSPSQYLNELSKGFKDFNADELEFVVSGIKPGGNILPYGVGGCLVRADYVVEVRYRDRPLVKRPCRMYCLFPSYIDKLNVRVLQVEPAGDLVEEHTPDTSSTPALLSDEERYKEAMRWYELKQKDRYLPVFRELAEKGYTEAEWRYGYCLHDEKKFGEAVYWYRRAVKKNHAKAQNSLGYCYESGEGVEKNLKQAVMWYRKSAEQGYAKAQCNLGFCFDNGEGVPKDLKQAVAWYTKAAEQGNSTAQFNLGNCYYNGEGVSADYGKAVEWYTRATGQGDTRAQNSLGLCYEWGRGVPKNMGKAVECYRAAAEKGHRYAQYNLGRCYESGSGVSKDLAKAMEWYAKAAEQGHRAARTALNRLKYNQAVADYDKGLYNLAFSVFKELAEQGDSDAQWDLGYCYYHGEGVSVDYGKAVEWYTKATGLGNVRAQNSLGICYELGRGVPKNMAKAVECYRAAAEKGYRYAQYNFGRCYESGSGVSKDLAKAMEWYAKAAKQGYKEAQKALEQLKTTVSSDSVLRYNQAVDAYKEGNYIIAYPIFKELAEQGDMNAQCYLGLCYQLGRGTSKSDRQAIDWYVKAAGQGSADALYNLAAYYERGVCVIKENEKAFDLYSRAATSGHADAQYVLGLLYSHRVGVSDKARLWFQKAAKQGHPKAIKTLKEASYITKSSVLYLEHLMDMAKGKVFSEPSKLL